MWGPRQGHKRIAPCRTDRRCAAWKAPCQRMGPARKTMGGGPGVGVAFFPSGRRWRAFLANVEVLPPRDRARYALPDGVEHAALKTADAHPHVMTVQHALKLDSNAAFA